MNSLLKNAIDRGRNGERLSEKEAVAIASISTPSELTAVGEAALANRLKRFGRAASWINNLHINLSNICTGGCTFCAFAVKENDKNAYILSEDEVLKDIREKCPIEVHIVGGLNSIWDFPRSLALIKQIRDQFSSLTIKGFTAVEIAHFAKNEEQPPGDILQQFKEAGLEGLPGGGAEIFSDKMRKKLCPDKLSGKEWLKIHKTAHEVGLWSNCTILYGCGETPEEQAEHLLSLREQQDKTKGFVSFIPLAYQHFTGKDDKCKINSKMSGPYSHLKMLALARLVLDNIPHIKAYWPMIGLETAAAGLSYGADDLDGTLGRERIAHAAGAATPEGASANIMEDTIKLAGFSPFQRTGNFQRAAEPDLNKEQQCPDGTPPCSAVTPQYPDVTPQCSDTTPTRSDKTFSPQRGDQ